MGVSCGRLFKQLLELFLRKKDELEKRIVDLMKELQNDKTYVVFIRLDDARENYALEKTCNQQNLKVKFEYSGPLRPQRNGEVEFKFQTLYGRTRAMINDSGIEGEIRNGLWPECAATPTYYETLL